MDDNKKDILKARIVKPDEILPSLKENFDIGRNLAAEYSPLSIIHGNRPGIVD